MVEFCHEQTAHCESGVLANLLKFHGLDISEPMAFGLGQGLFFAYAPFIRLNKLPLITYRATPGRLLKQVARGLGLDLRMRQFKDPHKAMLALDELLERGIPVGLQTGIFWLPYIPRAYRFHFNAHNLVVYGRAGDEYKISDPVMPFATTISQADLQVARFAQGALAPKGKLYFFAKVPATLPLAEAACTSLRYVAKQMSGVPFFLIGTRGMRFLAGRLGKWPARLGDRNALLHLGQVIRMQEEIGTGGAGFRLLYAAFLQECQGVLDDPCMGEFSARLTEIGDKWRLFAAMAARICKERRRDGDSFVSCARLICTCADREEQLFKDILRHLG